MGDDRSRGSLGKPPEPPESQSVGPAPPPVNPPARQAPGDFLRHLPHFEGSGDPLFITFATRDRWPLPEPARALVLQHILHDHLAKMHLICAVVMPDHAHMLYFPMDDAEGNRYTRTEVVGAIKSASAHAVNKLLKRQGPVWQDESFDHVTRRSEKVEAKAQYIVENPVRQRLCHEVDEYPYVWRAWVDGVQERSLAKE